MKKLLSLIGLLMCMIHFTYSQNQTINTETINKTITNLLKKDPDNKELISKGVKQLAYLWEKADGTNDDFISFCETNFVYDSKEKEKNFLRISEYLEAISGHYNEMSLQLQKNLHEATGPLSKVDEMFSAYDPSTHLSDDLYNNKIAFFIALNFPKYSLKEKELIGNNRLEWAYSRLGDMYTSRIPASVKQTCANAGGDADLYINNYNIYAGYLLNKKGEKLFPEEMILLSHWNLRDEIKTNYSGGNKALDKQQTIYEVMKRIINQEIPMQAINSSNYDWNPYTNKLFKNKEEFTIIPENNIRYQKLLNNFHAFKGIDTYTGNTQIDRKFSDEMEISLEDTETLLKIYLSAAELKKVGKIVKKRLKRNLLPFDIWYDGFKSRSNMVENKLSEVTRTLYPTAEALEKDLLNLLMKLGFTKERADYIAARIEVDAARGSGHAWGAAMKGQKSHLRTRIPTSGMDYKGYNIAIHEFGHNVEQVISLYDVDYYMLSGVPNNAFTEALAFVFQKRDLELLGMRDYNAEKENMTVLDKAWQLYEISGVALLDIAIWKWLYANPDATADELKETTIRLAKEVWNEYFAPVFEVKDEPILAIYSHMLNYPLYLSSYSFGQIIEFQLEQYFKEKDLAAEVDRIYRLGKITPNEWMIQATGNPLSVEPLLEAIRQIK